MTRIALVLACIAALTAVAGAADGSSAPASAQMQPLIVTLRDQADLRGVRGPRDSRLSQVVNLLRGKAAITQRPLRARLAVLRAQGKVSQVRPLWVVNALALRATAEVADELRRRPEVLSVTPDEEVGSPAAGGTAEPGVARVNAPAVWDAGFTGRDVVVASVDTGVSLTHAELSARWRGGSNSWYDPNGQHATPYDSKGHGTNTTGVMVAGDASSAAIGIAPDARWIAAKIFNDAGTASTSGIHLAYQWLLDPDRNPATADAPDVVNNSWGYSYPGCSLVFDPDLRNLRAAGILPIFSAGNSGPAGSTSVSPANNPSAFAVGATTSADQIYTYSARGPSACGEASTTFPEIVAPGVNVKTTDRYGGYTTATGTSMAAPAAAGVLALLLDAYPDLAVAQQEAALKTAADLGTPGPDNVFGYGRLDAAAALASIGPPPAPVPDFTIGSVPASVAVDPGAAASFTISVGAVNGFAGAVSLSVAGLPAGATAVFSPAQIDGAGTSELIVTTGSSSPAGEYPLTVTGTSGSLSHQTVSSLVVNAPPPPADFALGVSPASAATTAGGAVSYTVTSAASGGFSGEIGLSLAGLPSGASASFAPPSITGNGSSQLSVSTTPSTPTGTYALVVTGSSPPLEHTASMSLVVSAPPASQTLHPTLATVETGSRVGGSASSLAADDASYYAVSSATSGLSRVASWYGTFSGVASGQSLEVRYKGKCSATRTQAVSIWSWATSTWVQLDSRSVGTTDVLVTGLKPSGSPSSYVSAAGEVRVRVRMTGSWLSAGFTSSGNLLELVTGA